MQGGWPRAGVRWSGEPGGHCGPQPRLSLCLSEQGFIQFFCGPKVHSPEGFSSPSPWRGREKCHPRHLTNALTLAGLLQEGIRKNVSKATVFSGRNFTTARTLMTACVRKGPYLSLRPDVNLLVILPR